MTVPATPYNEGKVSNAAQTHMHEVACKGQAHTTDQPTNRPTATPPTESDRLDARHGHTHARTSLKGPCGNTGCTPRHHDGHLETSFLDFKITSNFQRHLPSVNCPSNFMPSALM